MGNIPSRRSTSQLVAEMPEATKEAEESFFRCPRGHQLPHRLSNGDCTPIYCAGEAKRQELTRAKSKRVKPPQEKAAEEALATAADEAVAHAKKSMERAKAKFDVRAKFMSVPAGLGGAAAEEYYDAQVAALLPYVAAELEYQLKFGDDAQRMAAAQKVMDTTGKGKKEVMGGGGATIIIKGNVELPWLKRAATITSTGAPMPTALPQQATQPSAEPTVGGEEDA